MAPLAPMFGMLASPGDPKASVTIVCVAVAARPAARYQKRNLTRPSDSSMLFPKIQRKSMLPRMCAHDACMNIEVNAPSYQGSGWICGVTGTWQGPETVQG